VQKFGPETLQTTLINLLPDTRYEAEVIPVYDDLAGEHGSDEGVTGKQMTRLLTSNKLFA